jgi:Lipocalin-like domain
MNYKPLFTLCALVALPLLSGCGGSGGVAVTAEQLVGRWSARSIAGPENKSSTCPGVIRWSDAEFACSSGDFIEFKADSTFTNRAGGDPDSGTWRVSGNKVTVTYTTGDSETNSVTITDTTMTVSDGEVSTTYQKL